MLTVAIVGGASAQGSDPDDVTQAVREPWGLLAKGAVLENLARPQAARAIYDDLVSRFADQPSLLVQEIVAAARDASLRITEQEHAADRPRSGPL